jgi:hypothetical protein
MCVINRGFALKYYIKHDIFIPYVNIPYLIVSSMCTHSGLIAGNPNMVVAFAGNKADLEDKRKVTAEVSIIVFSVFPLLK